MKHLRRCASRSPSRRPSPAGLRLLRAAQVQAELHDQHESSAFWLGFACGGLCALLYHFFLRH